jgi:hypothetical protein
LPIAAYDTLSSLTEPFAEENILIYFSPFLMLGCDLKEYFPDFGL